MVESKFPESEYLFLLSLDNKTIIKTILPPDHLVWWSAWIRSTRSRCGFSCPIVILSVTTYSPFSMPPLLDSKFVIRSRLAPNSQGQTSFLIGPQRDTHGDIVRCERERMVTSLEYPRSLENTFPPSRRFPLDIRQRSSRIVGLASRFKERIQATRLANRA